MITSESLTSFFAWSSAINLGFLVFASLLLGLARGSITRIHGRLFGLDEGDLTRAYFQYLGQYKTAVFIFNLAPYFALRIMG